MREKAVQSADYDLALELALADDAAPERVLQLLRSAIEEGDSRASYALGTWYLHGKNVRKDRKRAYALIERAAESGHPDALYDLAVFNEMGEVVEKDVGRALLLYIDAALHGDAQSHQEAGRIYWLGLAGEPDRTSQLSG